MFPYVCGISFDTVIVIKEGCKAYSNVPNVFTPNADGSNDMFTVSLKNVSSFNYQIFNRWGNVVKDSSINGILNGTNWNTFTLWDGKIDSGNEVPEGVYFYLIRIETILGKQDIKQGFIQLLR